MAKAAARKRKEENAEVEFPLLGYLDELVDDLRDHVPAALKEFDADAIHDARVSTRRLKAALDLLDRVLSKESHKPFATVLRKLRRRLGPLRDQDVMLEHLAELSKIARFRPACQWLSDRLKEERVTGREEARQQSSPVHVLARVGSWWGLREEVAEAREAVSSLLAESLHLQLDAFVEHADLICSQERPPSIDGPDGPAASPGRHAPARSSHRIASDRPLTDPSAKNTAHPLGARVSARPHDPHELRITGKALRYTLEMAREQGHALPADVAKSFKKMQESLGTWHDYVVLTEKAMAVSTGAMLAHHNAAMQEAVLDLARAAMQRAGRELRKFADLWGQKGPGLTQTIRAAFPLSRSLQEARQADPAAVTESKLVPNPADFEQTPVLEGTAQAVPSVA